MRKWIFVLAMSMFAPSGIVFAQPKEIARPPEFEKVFGPEKFDPTKLRAAIAFPISHTMINLDINSGRKDEELPPVAEIEKKLVGDERDAEWLFKLGDALAKKKSDRAKDAYERSAAAFRKRIEKEPKVAKHYLDLIDPLTALERWDDSLATARKCVELDPKHAGGWAGLRTGYWREFIKLAYGDSKENAWNVGVDRPPPEIVRALTDAQKDQARTLLKYIKQCHQEWKRNSPVDLYTLIEDTLLDSHWELFDHYFRSGDWSQEKSEQCQIWFSKKLRETLMAHGHQYKQPEAFGLAAVWQIRAFAVGSSEKDWIPGKMTFEQKKAIAAILEPVEKMSADADRAIAVKANFILGAIGMLTDDLQQTNRYGARALALAPREKATIDLMVMANKDSDRTEFERFWTEHARKFPSVRVWCSMFTSTSKKGV